MELDPKQEIFPLSNPSFSRLSLGNEGGEYAVMSTGPYGFRNPKDTSPDKPTDILMIGDSYTAGYSVPDGQEIAAVLRTLGNSVVNLGVGGNGPMAEFATLSEYGPVFRPKIVVWLYYDGNDLDNLRMEKTDATLLKYLRSDFTQNLANAQDRIDDAMKSCAETLYKKAKKRGERTEQTPWSFQFVKLSKLRHKISSFSLGYPFYYTQNDLDSLNEVLVKAKKKTASWGGRLVFVYLSAYQRFNNEDGGDNYESSRGKHKVLSFVRRLDIPGLDLTPVFTSRPDALALFPFRLEGHYSKQGYRLVAKQISDFIKKIQIQNLGHEMGLKNQTGR